MFYLLGFFGFNFHYGYFNNSFLNYQYIEHSNINDSDGDFFIHVFSDYGCKLHCKNNINELDKLRKSSIYKNKNIIIKMHYLDRFSNDIYKNKASYCMSKKENFYKFQNFIYDKNPDYDEIVSYIEKNNNIDDFKKCFVSEDTELKVKNSNVLSHLLGISAVPTTIINGKQFIGTMPLENLIYEIEKISN